MAWNERKLLDRTGKSAQSELLPFNRPFMVGTELDRIAAAIANNHLSGDGAFSRLCQQLLSERFGVPALLTPSCTAALELATLLLAVKPGDEVIVPSFTFVSGASAVALRGGVPVFVDIDPETLNIDPKCIEDAVTELTVGIIATHYASIACDMAAIEDICTRHGIWLVEDAAHCFGATYDGQLLGTFGRLSTLSFHETKNIISGEGGALLVNDPSLLDRAQIVWQKGTNRQAFLEGRIEKYSWVDIGSSFPPSEITAAFLSVQLEAADEISADRMAVWQAYHQRLASLERRGLLRRPIVPENCTHNAHIYYVLLPEAEQRSSVLQHLREKQIDAVFHYVPLHSAQAGECFGRAHGALSNTDDLSARLIRLPLWPGLSDTDIDRVVTALADAVE